MLELFFPPKVRDTGAALAMVLHEPALAWRYFGSRAADSW